MWTLGLVVRDFVNTSSNRLFPKVISFHPSILFRKTVGSVARVCKIKATKNVLRSLVFLTDVLLVI